MHVLLVDDNAMNVELFRAVLEADGHSVSVETDGTAAHGRAQSESFDLLLLDIQLPGMDGFAICRSLRSSGLAGPIVALSSAAMPEQIQRGADAGFDEYLTKPIAPAMLRAAVRKYQRP